MVEINLVQNGGFEQGIDGWDVDPGAGSLEATHATDGADRGSVGCLSLTSAQPEGSDPTGPRGTVSQQLAEDVTGELLGRQLSFSIRVDCDTAGALFAFISEDGGETCQYGVGNADSRGHGRPDGGNVVADEYETLRCERFTLSERSADDAPKEVVYGVEVRKPCAGSLDNAVLVVGAAAMNPEDTISGAGLRAISAPATATPQRSRAPSHGTSTHPRATAASPRDPQSTPGRSQPAPPPARSQSDPDQQSDSKPATPPTKD